MKKGILAGLFFIFFISGFITNIHAQVNVTATLATPTGSYTTLKAAFDAINAGTHQGAISIEISANITETAPAVLNSSGAGAASYTSVMIRPSADNIVISGATISGRGLIELNGADNVSFNGDNPNTAGTNRNLSIINTADSTINYTSCIRIALSSLITSADNNSVQNCIIRGSARNRNITGITSTTSSAGTVFGIVVSAGASTSAATNVPSALTSATTTTGTTVTVLNFQVNNNHIYSASRGVSINANGANVADGLTINNNLIGNTDPLNSIYYTGITVQGCSNAIINGNTIQNVQSFLATSIRGIDVGVVSSTVSGATIRQNSVNGVVNNNPATYGATGISITAGTNHTVANNMISDCRNSQASGTGGFGAANGSSGIRILAGTGHKILHNSVHLFGTIPGTTSTNLSAAFVMSASSQTGVEVRNNIFSNQLGGGNPTGTRHVCIALPSGATSAMNLTLDRNAYFAGTDPLSRMAISGTTAGTGEYLVANFIPTSITPANNFRSYSSTLNGAGTNDNFSFALSTPPPYISSTNLHIPAATVTKLESGGVLTAVVTDIDGDARPGPVGSVNGGASAPDIGADEFDGTPVSVDLSVTQLVLPALAGCHGSSDTVRVKIQNLTSEPVDFSVDSMMINAYTTGANPVVFPQVVVNTGILAGSGSMNVTIVGNYNLSITGVHTFHASVDIAGDNISTNDTLTPVSIPISGGTATATTTNICIGSSATLTATGYTNGGSLQWQSSPDNVSWSNIPGAVSPSYSPTPTDTIFYRVMVCGLYFSASDTINVIDVQPPVASNVTRCGTGTADLTATGVGLNWYDVPTGGVPVGSGPLFTTPVLTPGTTTYYVSSSVGGAGAGQYVGPLNPSVVGAGGYVNYDTYRTFFTVVNPVNILSVDIFAQTTGVSSTINIVSEPSGTIVASVPYTTTTSGSTTVGQTVMLNVPLVPGNYSMKMGDAVVSLYRNTIGSAFPYSLPSISITGQSFSGYPEYYYYFYNWQLGNTGCESPRTPVTVTVTPSDTIIASVTTNPICANQTTPMNVTSTEPNYQYTWSPAAGLNTTIGSSVITSTDTNITYTIHAIDPSTGCESTTTASVSVLPLPSLSVSPADTTLCFGTSIPLYAESTGMIVADVTVGAGTSSNTATSTTILGPYGGYYGGARHQYLLLASDLIAAGLTAGPIEYVQFEVTALNGVPALTDYTIKAGPTALAALTPSYVAGLPTLYYASSYTPVLGWNVHQISPVIWNGTDNMVIEVCFNNNDGGAANGNASVRYTATSGTNTVNYFRADDDPNVCAMFSGTVGINRPNIRLSRGASISYQWLPAAGLSDNDIANPVLTANTSANYTITVTDDSSGCYNTATIPVVVNPTPVFTIGNDTALCSNGSSAGFFLGSTNTSLFYTWQDSSVVPAYLVTEPGVYYATGTDANGCSSTDTVTVIAAEPASVDININIVTPNTAILDAGPGYAGYSWYNLASTQSITVTGNGTYWVTITDMNGCTNSDTVSIIFSLGIGGENGNQGEISFYPNPSSGMIWIQGKGLNGEPLKIEILDLNGRSVYMQTIEEPGEDFTRQADLSTVAEGTYLVRISSSGSVYTGRIIIAGK